MLKYFYSEFIVKLNIVSGSQYVAFYFVNGIP